MTDENRADAQRLSAIWSSPAGVEARKRSGALSQRAFGLRFGLGTQGAVSQFLRGHTALSLRAALAFARGLSCSVADFSPSLAEKITYAMPPGAPATAYDPGPSFPLEQAVDILVDAISRMPPVRGPALQALLAQAVGNPAVRMEVAREVVRMLKG